MNRIDASLTDSSCLRVLVFKEIERGILSGEFDEGEALVEQRLSDELGVSRTPVREALRQLELEGLIKTVPNKGAIVIGVSEKDIEDIYTIRIRVEGLASRWAAEHITKAELKALHDVVDLQEFYAEKGDYDQVWQLDTRFHAILYDACQSRPMKHMLSVFHNYITRARELSVKAEGRARLSVAEHRELLVAINAHDSDKAEELTALHIINAKDNLLRSLQVKETEASR